MISLDGTQDGMQDDLETPTAASVEEAPATPPAKPKKKSKEAAAKEKATEGNFRELLNRFATQVDHCEKRELVAQFVAFGGQAGYLAAKTAAEDTSAEDYTTLYAAEVSKRDMTKAGSEAAAHKAVSNALYRKALSAAVKAMSVLDRDRLVGTGPTDMNSQYGILFGLVGAMSASSLSDNTMLFPHAPKEGQEQWAVVSKFLLEAVFSNYKNIRPHTTCGRKNPTDPLAIEFYELDTRFRALCKLLPTETGHGSSLLYNLLHKKGGKTTGAQKADALAERAEGNIARITPYVAGQETLLSMSEAFLWGAVNHVNSYTLMTQPYILNEILAEKGEESIPSEIIVHPEGVQRGVAWNPKHGYSFMSNIISYGGTLPPGSPASLQHLFDWVLPSGRRVKISMILDGGQRARSGILAFANNLDVATGIVFGQEPGADGKGGKKAAEFRMKLSALAAQFPDAAKILREFALEVRRFEAVATPEQVAEAEAALADPTSDSSVDILYNYISAAKRQSAAIFAATNSFQVKTTNGEETPNAIGVSIYLPLMKQVLCVDTTAHFLELCGLRKKVPERAYSGVSEYESTSRGKDVIFIAGALLMTCRIRHGHDISVGNNMQAALLGMSKEFQDTQVRDMVPYLREACAVFGKLPESCRQIRRIGSAVEGFSEPMVRMSLAYFCSFMAEHAYDANTLLEGIGNGNAEDGVTILTQWFETLKTEELKVNSAEGTVESVSFPVVVSSGTNNVKTMQKVIGMIHALFQPNLEDKLGIES